MRKSMLIAIPLILGLFVLISACGRQKLLKAHALQDEADGVLLQQLDKVLADLSLYADSVTYYYDLAGQSGNAEEKAYYENRLHAFDLLFHESGNEYRNMEEEMDELHHCGMQESCDNMMNDHAMMGHGRESREKDADHCNLMEHINSNCSELEEIEYRHERYCTL